MISIGKLTIYEIGVIVFFILFIVVSIQTYFRHLREEHEDLQRFREQERLEVIATEERKKLVKKHLNSQILLTEDVESARELSQPLDLENAPDDSNVTTSSEEKTEESEAQDNVFTRTIYSAGNSLRGLLGSATTSKNECSICLSDFQADETISWAKSKDCSHVYHEDCIIQWLEKHDECPLCRVNLFKRTDCEDDCEEPIAVLNENPEPTPEPSTPPPTDSDEFYPMPTTPPLTDPEPTSAPRFRRLTLSRIQWQRLRPRLTFSRHPPNDPPTTPPTLMPTPLPTGPEPFLGETPPPTDDELTPNPTPSPIDTELAMVSTPPPIDHEPTMPLPTDPPTPVPIPPPTHAEPSPIPTSPPTLVHTPLATDPEV